MSSSLAAFDAQHGTGSLVLYSIVAFASTNTHSSIGTHPLLRKARLTHFTFFQFLPVVLKVDFSGNGLQLTQAAETQKLPCGFRDRLGIIFMSCDLLEQCDFLPVISMVRLMLQPSPEGILS